MDAVNGQQTEAGEGKQMDSGAAPRTEAIDEMRGDEENNKRLPGLSQSGERLPSRCEGSEYPPARIEGSADPEARAEGAPSARGGPANAALTVRAAHAILIPGEGENDPIHPEDALNLKNWASGKALTTKRLYRRIVLGLFRRYPGKRLAEFQKHELETYFAERGRALGSPESLKTEAQVIKSLFSFASRDGAIPKNPGALIQKKGLPPELKLQRRSMSVEETRLLIHHASCTRDRVLFRFLYATGARVSEVAGRRWEHLTLSPDGSGRLLIIGKGSRPAVIRIPKGIYEELLSLREPAARSQDPIFSSLKDRTVPMSAGGIWERVKLAAKRAGIFKPVSPHWFRHANASHALLAGCPLSVVRETLRHASISTTSWYVHAQGESSTADYLDFGVGEPPTAQVVRREDSTHKTRK